MSQEQHNNGSGTSHSSFGGFASPRRWLRDRLFDLVRNVARHHEGRAAAYECLRDLLRSPAPLHFDPQSLAPAYPDLGVAPANHLARDRQAIIITGRFRSGSTLLWNLFRHLPFCTSYYEPFNERQWFNPARRGSHVDASHRGVEEYWSEYDGLADLGRHYREEWTCRSLLMDEHAWDADMEAYVRMLIDRAPQRPVLQCNRIDLRLPWFRKHFPGATFVHLYRHPRDQWLSTLMKPERFPASAGWEQYQPHDHFYLMNWLGDLKYHFPFLDPAQAEHPYQSFYYLWKLSFLFGRKYSHHSVSFESLVLKPEVEIPALLRAVNISQDHASALQKLIDAPAVSKWSRYADDAWFKQHESRCEQVLAQYLGVLQS